MNEIPQDNQKNEIEEIDTYSEDSELERYAEAPIKVNGRFQSVTYTGPLPPPNVLEQYNKSESSAADRIIKMAEKEQDFEHRMHEKLADAQIIDQKQERQERGRGQTYGLLIGLFAIACGSVTAINGSNIAGTFIGTSGVAGLVSVFVVGHKKEERE